ncbi:MAG: histidine triad nucleotide-binding protein [Desulfobulbus sp.]|jgi:histidine triad (HIT) family protein|nr:histidine triad nucleotide-binding protein [Desulfobulbus sp.]
MPENCLFCKIVRGEIPAVKLYEDEDVIAFRDIAPQAPLHILVIPKKHLVGPATVSVEDERVVGKMMRVGNEISVREGFPQYRTVCNNGVQAGQTVFHLHMHIIGGRSMTWPPG